MKWLVAAIGKPSLRYAKDGVEEYRKRLRRYTDVEVDFAGKDQGPEGNAEWLLRRSEGSVRIALDERGERWTTGDFAKQVEAWQLDGTKRASLLIGGADGHPESLRGEADHVLSLSAFTLQHELALVVLLEQIYRVHTLLRGEPYHR